MSAYLVIEATVRDREALDRYASQAIPLIRQFGGEVIVFGPWELLFGERAYDWHDCPFSGQGHRFGMVQFADLSSSSGYSRRGLRLPLPSRWLAKPCPANSPSAVTIRGANVGRVERTDCGKPPRDYRRGDAAIQGARRGRRRAERADEACRLYARWLLQPL